MSTFLVPICMLPGSNETLSYLGVPPTGIAPQQPLTLRLCGVTSRIKEAVGHVVGQ